MSRKRKKKRVLPPRSKRMNRSRRLRSASSWLKEYNGNNILRGYCKHFAVDRRCAAIELRQLTVTIDEQYLQRRAESDRQLVLNRQRRKEPQAAVESDSECPSCDSAFEAYLAGDFAAPHAVESKYSADDLF